MLPGKRDFYRCCKARRSASHVNKEFPAAISKLRSASLRVIRTKFARTIINIIIIGERAKRARNSQVCSIENRIYTRIMVTIKKRAGVIPYSFSSSIALLSSLLSCSFYLLDPRTISRVDILEMT